MVAAVNRAHRAYESTRGQDPEYLAHLPEAQLSGLTGLAFLRRGDCQEAATYLRAAIAGTAQYPRERAAWQIRLAQSYLKAGALADGCGELINNFSSISSVASSRLQAALTDIAEELRRHVDVTEAREFLGLWTAR